MMHAPILIPEVNRLFSFFFSKTVFYGFTFIGMKIIGIIIMIVICYLIIILLKKILGNKLVYYISGGRV